jgi:MFS transporter, DHA1 family, multidrug resistance protein
MDKKANPIASLIVISILLLPVLTAFSPTVNAEQTILNDNFTTDSTLDSSIWKINGPVGTNVFAGVKNEVDAGYGGSYFVLIDPRPSFSNQGMLINSVNEPFTMATIESINYFSAPLTLQASVMATQSGGAPFCMWLVTDQNLVGFDGDLTPGAKYYGIWSDYTKFWNKLISSYPQLNAIYQLTAIVDSSGGITLTVNLNGQTIGSVSEQSIGTGPFKVVLAQYEIYSGTGTGPNQAYWKSVTITSSSSSNSPTPPASTSSKPSSSPTSPSTTSSALPSNSPPPFSSANPTPPVLPSLTPSISTSNTPIVSSVISATVNLVLSPLLISILVIVVISTVASIWFTAYELRRRNKTSRLSKDGQLNLVSEKIAPESSFLKRGLLPLMLIAGVSAGISNIVMVTFASDIAKTFFGNFGPDAIGAVSQLGTLNAIGVFFFTLVSSFLIVKFRQKYLFIAGLILIIISSIGSYLSPTIILLQLFSLLEGIGSIMISITSAVIIGNYFPANQKAKAIGYIMAIGAATTLIMIPLLGFIVNIAGWRFCFTFLVLPIAFGALVLSSFVIPSKTREKTLIQKENPYKESLKLVWTNKSAIACLIASLLTVAGGQVAVFAMAFYRARFGAPRDLTVGIYEAAIGLAFIGYLVSGFLINRFGAKRLALLSTAANCCLTATFFFVPNLWFAFTLDMAHVWFASMATPAFIYLGLEQVPKYRWTMVSLGNLFNTVGNIIAPALGGALLVYATELRYGAVGIALASMTLAACGVAFVWVKDMGYIHPKSKVTN